MRDHAGRKGVKGLLLVGHEEMPRGFGLRTGAQAGVAQWIECWPMNQSVASSILSQAIRLGCGPGPPEGVCERQSHIDVSLPLFLPPFPSLKINK